MVVTFQTHLEGLRWRLYFSRTSRICSVCRRCSSLDSEKIQVRETEQVKEGSPNGVDEALEAGGSGCKTHWHDLVFVQTKCSLEGGGGNGSWGDADVRESGADVKLGEDLGRRKAGQRDVILIQLDLII